MTRCTPVLISIGANLASQDGREARATCAAAVEALRALPGLRLVRSSRWYATAPIPPGGPPYVNGVTWLDGAADPAGLLALLQAIEARAGRVRSTANAPRTLDLDIVAMGAVVRVAPDPVLPHPRAHLRRFVMQPLADLLPDWRHPLLHRTAAQVLAALPAQEIRLL